jgi:hypothetical protein
VADDRSLSVLIWDEAFLDSIDSPLAFAVRRESFSLRRSISRSRSSWGEKKNVLRAARINQHTSTDFSIYLRKKERSA